MQTCKGMRGYFPLFEAHVSLAIGLSLRFSGVLDAVTIYRA